MITNFVSWFKMKLNKARLYARIQFLEEIQEDKRKMQLQIRQKELEIQLLKTQLKRKENSVVFINNTEPIKKELLSIGYKKLTKRRLTGSDFFVGVFSLATAAYIQASEIEVNHDDKDQIH